MRKLLMTSALLLFAASGSSAEVKTGGSKMIEVDGKYHVWTDRVGHGPVKMLTLHGGPGFPHDYFECFEDFLPQHGIQFYYYDQLGVGNSDQPDDASLWTVARYRDEVEQVRKGLGLDHFYLYGHSWGGMLAIEYALEHQDHLKALIISDMTAGIPAYEKYAATLLAELSPEDQQDAEEVRGRGQVRRAGVPADHDGQGLRGAPAAPRSVAGAGGARVREVQSEDLQHDAGPERVRHQRQLQGLGSLGRSAEDQSPDADHRRPPRHDEPGRHPAHGTS